MSRRPSAVRWLTAQALVFGFTAVLLAVIAYALFLDAYGSRWLPVAYVGIAAAGVVVSGAAARSFRRWSLVAVASAVLLAGAVVFAASWLVTTVAEQSWPAAMLVVLFPLVLQLGFVFIGGQAGRILDIQGIKASLPGIMAGFPIGAVIASLVASPLIDLFGRTEHLLLLACGTQLLFLGLLLGTSRRFGVAVASPPPAAPEHATPRKLFDSRFVVLLFGYQVLSALGTQLVDFLVFDRAGVRYSGTGDLGRFVARYTAAINITSLLFLALLAGPLLRRFGLRLGIAANPAFVTALMVAVSVVAFGPGAASFALFVLVTAARISDLALTDGMTRTSINATYQVLPSDQRLPIQAKVEGVGVPLAIGTSGLILLVLQHVPARVTVTVVVTGLICAVWLWTGLLLYRHYGKELVAALRRRRLVDDEGPLETGAIEDAAAHQLLASPDGRDVRLGLDLLTMSAAASVAELEVLAGDHRGDVRVTALGNLAAAGHPGAAHRLGEELPDAAGSTDAEVRLAAADALAVSGVRQPSILSKLLVDSDPRVRAAALAAVRGGDDYAVPAAIAALAHPRTAAAAHGAIGRLGNAVLPAAREALSGCVAEARPETLRLVRAMRGEQLSILAGTLAHADRDLGLAALHAITGGGPAPAELHDALAASISSDAAAARRLSAASAAVYAGPLSLRRALSDEFALRRECVAAAVEARYGRDRLGTALADLRSGDGQRRSVARETIEVTAAHADARIVLSVVAAEDGSSHPPGDPAAAIDAILFHGAGWSTPWLRLCAVHAAGQMGVALDAESLAALHDSDIDAQLAAAIGRQLDAVNGSTSTTASTSSGP